jgi:hypothetical protein
MVFAQPVTTIASVVTPSSQAMREILNMTPLLCDQAALRRGKRLITVHRDATRIKLRITRQR